MATFLGLALALLVPPLIAVVSQRPAAAKHPIGAHLVAQAALAAVVLAVLAIAHRWEQLPLSAIGLRSPTWQSLAWGVGLAVFFRYGFAPATYWLLRRAKLGGFERGLATLEALPTWTLVLAVLIGGAAEEILYRGYAVDRLAALTGSLWIGAALAVLAFALAHLPLWGVGPALSTGLSGAIFTLVFLWRQDLTANIVAHIITDLNGIVLSRRQPPP